MLTQMNGRIKISDVGTVWSLINQFIFHFCLSTLDFAFCGPLEGNAERIFPCTSEERSIFSTQLPNKRDKRLSVET
ncbi:hypothetical protein GYH30_051509 [Glycine max]|uniref:Uncharacterized protein n=1 Tax=Glycine max TaxID=3847 RepID=A0A0R0F611_SOYBN|nr:hypothetical protein JHK87_051697 [Glycine soja]KAH1156736.1 hypothetical protein GYH30_051509 [Glycine max]